MLSHVISACLEHSLTRTQIRRPTDGVEPRKFATRIRCLQHPFSNCTLHQLTASFLLSLIEGGSRSLHLHHIRFRIASNIIFEPGANNKPRRIPCSTSIQTFYIRIGIHTVGQYGFRRLRDNMHKLATAIMCGRRPHFDDGGLNGY